MVAANNIIVIYLVITMFFTLISDYTGLNSGITEEQTDTMEQIKENMTTKLGSISSSGPEHFDPLGFLSDYLKIIIKGATFSFVIAGAPDVINSLVSLIFGIFSFIFLMSMIQVVIAAVAGVFT